MTAPRKTAGAVHFEQGLDAALPGRRKPDGWIGDEAHRLRTSSHNPDDTPGSKPEWNGDPDTVPEVRALDIAAPLTPDVSGQDLVDHLRTLPGVGSVIRYMIHDGRIYHVNAGFKPAAYSGDPHTGHVHITFAFTQAADNNTTYNYRLGDLVPLTADDKKWISAEIKKQVEASAADIGAAVLKAFRQSIVNLSDTAMNEIGARITRAILVDEAPIAPFPKVAERMGLPADKA